MRLSSRKESQSRWPLRKPRSLPASATTTSTDSTSRGLLLQVGTRPVARARRRRSPSTRTSPTGCGSSGSSRSSTSCARPLPDWGGDLAAIDFDNIYYYISPTEKQAKSWEDLPPDIKDTWDKLGIPEAEKKYLAGVGAQYESEVVYHKLKEDLEKQGVLFLDMDSGLREHEDLVKEYFGKIIPQNDNKFAALNSAVWSGGSFIYVPPGRQDRDAAPGLLPHQRGEHGPVRAHADHRRRGRVRALRRGLHGADLLDRLAALGGRRDHRQEGRALPLHDDPELVEQRLQPRHEARRRVRGRDDGVGRRRTSARS